MEIVKCDQCGNQIRQGWDQVNARPSFQLKVFPINEAGFRLLDFCSWKCISTFALRNM